MEAAGAVSRQPPPVPQQPPGLSPLAVGDVLPPKRQAVVDRLRRRIESYRRRQTDCMPRFDQSFSGLCEQNLQDTLALKQRFLETKAKRQPKVKDKKQNDNSASGAVGGGGGAGNNNSTNNSANNTTTAALQSSVHVQQKFLKRPAEDLDTGGAGAGDGYEPPVKLQCQSHQQQNEVHKFSVEIVQQLEFTTSAANSQPQQISTNVTVKALTNASVKSDVSSPKSNPSTPASTQLRPNSGIGCVDIGTLVECKQEPDNEFVDLDQCAAALEKDAAANGFAGISDLIGDDTNDEIITPDDFKSLISEITDYHPEFMKEFDFEDKSVDSVVNGLKTEDVKELPQTQNMSSEVKSSNQSPLLQQQNAYSPPVFDGQSMAKSTTGRMGYSNMDFGKTELSPAAQTLKQMAEQHHKNQMGLSFNPNSRTPNSRSPYTDFQFQQNDYVGSPNSNASNVPSYHKQNSNFPQPPEMIKQEMIYQSQNEFDLQKRKAAAAAAAAAAAVGQGMYKQQYSPYGSPSASGHGSPGYLPRGGANSAPTAGNFTGGTPPRPPSGPGNQQSTTLQINQAQQLHINQSGHGNGIQVSAGQHLHLSGDLKGNVSVAAQQGMFFSQQGQQQQQTNAHQSSNAGQQQQQQQQQAQQQQQQQAQQQQQQGPQSHQQSGPGPGGPQMNAQSQQHAQNTDSYTVSQSQTINFTQQSLSRRTNGPTVPTNPGMVPNTMPTGMGGPRHMTPQSAMEQQQKLIQQQQLLRAQQAAAMQQQQQQAQQQAAQQQAAQQQAAQQQQQQQQQAQQQHMAGMARPPPPDYKTSAGMIHGMQPRYSAVPPTMRRLPHQPMPPSGPMMRPHNIYMMSQQHMARGMYPRQQAPMQAAAPDTMPQHGSAEWRHLLMSQQQSASFTPQMRPNFHTQGYSVGNAAGNMQMTALQHQQMRTQGMVGANMGQNPMQQAQQNSMGQAGTQMGGGQLNMGSPLNQHVMSHAQQQQQNLLQQNASQMSMNSLHMSQSQSLSVTNQSVHQTLNNQQQQQQHQQQQQQQQQLVNSHAANQSNALSSYAQTADFSLEFLESLPTGDTSSFTDQELLNSFDADSGFNLQDIL